VSYGAFGALHTGDICISTLKVTEMIPPSCCGEDACALAHRWHQNGVSEFRHVGSRGSSTDLLLWSGMSSQVLIPRNSDRVHVAGASCSLFTLWSEGHSLHRFKIAFCDWREGLVFISYLSSSSGWLHAPSRNWRDSSRLVGTNGLLNSMLLTKFPNWFRPIDLLKFNGGVLIQKFIDWQVTSANSNVDPILINLDSNSLWAKLVNALTFTHKHDLEFWFLGIVVDVFCKRSIYWVILVWNIDCTRYLSLQLPDVLLLFINFRFGIFQLFEDLQGGSICTIHFLFQLNDIIRGILMFFLKLASRCVSLFFSNAWHGQLVFEILAAMQFLLLRYDLLSFLVQIAFLTFNLGLLQIDFVFIFVSEAFHLLGDVDKILRLLCSLGFCLLELFSMTLCS